MRTRFDVTCGSFPSLGRCGVTLCGRAAVCEVGYSQARGPSRSQDATCSRVRSRAGRPPLLTAKRVLELPHPDPWGSADATLWRLNLHPVLCVGFLKLSLHDAEPLLRVISAIEREKEDPAALQWLGLGLVIIIQFLKAIYFGIIIHNSIAVATVPQNLLLVADMVRKVSKSLLRQGVCGDEGESFCPLLPFDTWMIVQVVLGLQSAHPADCLRICFWASNSDVNLELIHRFVTKFRGKW
jgi:hypothetical protein